MKKTLMLLIVVALFVSMVFVGISCKKETEVGASETTATETTVAATTVAATTAAATTVAAGPVNLKWWRAESEGEVEFNKVIDDIILKYEQENQNVKIELQLFPYEDLWDKLVLSLATDTAPDIFLMNDEQIAYLAEANNLAPMPVDMEDRFWKSGVFESLKPGISFDDRVVMMPYSLETDIIFYNKDMFISAGLDPNKPPETWQDLVDYGKKLTKKDESGKFIQTGYGLRFAGNPPGIVQKFLPILWSMGGDIMGIGEDGKYKSLLTTEATVNAFQFYLDFIYNYQISSLDFPSPDEQFAQKLTAMYPREPWVIAELQNTGSDIDYGLADIPTWNGNRSTIMYLLGHGVLNNPNSNEAWKFMEYALNPENELALNKSISGLAFREPTYEDAFYSDPNILKFKDSIKYARVQWQQKNVPEILDIVAKAIEKILYKQMNVKDALTEAENQINSILSK